MVYLNQKLTKYFVILWKSYIFAVDFNPTKSFEGYAFEAPEGEWELELDTDEKRYDGFSRLIAGEKHIAGTELRVYLPCRCALVFKKTNK